VSHAAEYLANTGQQAWSEEIALMIDMPHKVRAYTDRQYPLVELFRKSDLVDLSWGVVRYGIPRSYVTAVQKQFPNHGFHRFLMHSAAAWWVKHPLNPAPFLRWCRSRRTFRWS